ncbi:MAG TPA: saccharopine dehydrogenase C-terminal domain-containing protein [Bacteroidia bacterium]|nr:saccharopine dehydrogenase C-terminal domain-containing protein [Bacteroidia bacterium]
MHTILLVGAGRSSSSLISYLLTLCRDKKWNLVVGDVSQEAALAKTKGDASAKAILFDVNNADQCESEVKNCSLVISLLPPHLHHLMAVECIKQKKHFITASYLSPEIQALHEEAQNAGILMLNECGLDPGIDHMSAMEVINRLKADGCELTAFRSYTGGLVAPESNDNPWGYKFSWNPRNVIVAGQGTARYIRDGEYKYLPYNRLFTDIETIRVDGVGSFDGYANRDSLAYRHHYTIENIPTLLRGTLRQSGYCRAWDVFVKLGLTDDSFKVEHSEKLTYAQLIKAFLPGNFKSDNLVESVARFCGLPLDGEAMSKVTWTGIFEEELIGISDASPAMILQHLLEQKWKLQPHDKDMIVMQHQFEYVKNGEIKKLVSSLVVKGDDQIYTAMAKTVGLPLGIAAKLVLEVKIKITGVHIPVLKEIYEPILKELEAFGINFVESE